ncbi:glycosyltransferase [bacterium]|nr:glycosyltransferase [bacterium]
MKVHIIISILNGAEYIEESIESILNQTYKNWKLHLIDNGSTDNTYKILNKYANLNNNKIAVARFEKNLIPSTRWSQQIANSKSDCIAISCHDDIWKPDKLEKQIAIMKARNSDIIHSNVDFIDHLGRLINGGSKKANDYRNVLDYDNLNFIDLSSKLCEKNSINLSSVLIKTNVVREFGAWEPERWGGEDWGLWVKLAANKCKFSHLRENLVSKRVNIGNTSTTSRYERSFGFLKSFELVKSLYPFIQTDSLLKKENEIYERIICETLKKGEYNLANKFSKYFLQKKNKSVRDFLIIIVSRSKLFGRILLKLNERF